MDYSQSLSYLYNRLPMFQQKGASAYKEGLANTHLLDAHLGHPHRHYPTIHVGGTNGKGSCSHTLAAILQSAGYKVGLYTSPHLVDFRERIRVDGEPVSEEFVTLFVEKERDFFEPLEASFFEVTTAMAFAYFAAHKVDVAVIEVGLGGRLDCTNIITPKLSIITNISPDHTKQLGETLPLIAAEKAGIIKEGVPVVIGETTEETRLVFEQKAKEKHAPLIFAEEESVLLSTDETTEGGWEYNAQSPFMPDEDRVMVYDNPYVSQQLPLPEVITFFGELGGYAQIRNTNTLLIAIQQLYRMGFRITPQHLKKGFARVCELTGLRGRWEKLSDSPRLYCDTGHNIGGMTYIVEQLSRQKFDTLRIVIGMVNDKDIQGILDILPRKAVYYFTQASVERALPAEALQQLATEAGLQGTAFPNVEKAVQEAMHEASPLDFVFVGGSSFVVADLLSLFLAQEK